MDLHELVKPGEEEEDHVRQRLLRRAAKELAEPHLKAHAEAGLEKLADGLVAEQHANGREEQGAEDLQRTGEGQHESAGSFTKR